MAAEIKTALIAFIISLAAAFLAPAQIPGTFTHIEMDGGGWFTGFVQHPDGRVYGRTDVGGVYRTDNFGESWIYLSGELPTEASLIVQGIAVSPTDEDTVYQAVGVSYFNGDPTRGIYKSTDGGRNWSHVKTGINFSGNDSARHGGECIIVHPTTNSEVWAGSRQDGLWKSTNAGDTWTEIAPGTFGDLVIVSVYIQENFPDQIWVGTEGGAYVSTNRGNSWTKVLDQEVVYRISRRPNGETFISGGSYNPGTPNDTKLWKVTSPDWSDLSEYTFTDIWDNYLDGFEAARFYRPTDLGAAITILRNGDIIAGTFFQGLAKSSDGGNTFTYLPFTLPPGADIPRWAAADRSTTFGGTNQVLQDATLDDRWYLTGGYGPSRTDDAGATGKFIFDGIGEVVTWPVRFHPTDPDKVLIPNADHATALVTDGGRGARAFGQASQFFPFPDDIVIFAHSMIPVGDETLLGFGGAAFTQEPRIFESTDNGTTWSKRASTGHPEVSGNPWVDALDAGTDGSTIVALLGGIQNPGEGGIYRSTDGGNTFTQRTLPSSSDGTNAGDEFNWRGYLAKDGGGTLYLGIEFGGIYRSTNAGLTWTTPSTAGIPTFAGTIAADSGIADTIYWASDVGLAKSEDAGDSFTNLPGFTKADFASAHDGRVAVVGRRTEDNFDKIYYSADGGDTWDEISRPGFRFASSRYLAVDPYRPGQVWISTAGRSVSVFRPALTRPEWREENLGTSQTPAPPPIASTPTKTASPTSKSTPGAPPPPTPTASPNSPPAPQPTARSRSSPPASAVPTSLTSRKSAPTSQTGQHPPPS